MGTGYLEIRESGGGEADYQEIRKLAGGAPLPNFNRFLDYARNDKKERI
jgi:hypothetical protein